MNQAFQALWSGRPQRTKLAIAALAFTTTAVSLLSVALMFPPAGRAGNGDEFETFTVDVTQDASTNAQNNLDPSKGQDTLSRGDTFIVDGSLYPSHTLQKGVADVSPSAHPIGNYRIRGTALISGDDFARAVAEDPTAPHYLFLPLRHFCFPMMARVFSLRVSGRTRTGPPTAWWLAERDASAMLSAKPI